MYKSLTANDFRARFSLGEGYEVAGLISYGAWDIPKHQERIKRALDSLNVQFSARFLQGFLSNVLELDILGKKYWFIVMYGGTMLSEYVHVACMLGSKKNIHIGSCGGLNPNINSCELIVPIWTHGDESVTRMYDRGSKDSKHYPDEHLSGQLIEKAGSEYAIHRGSIITIQAMLAETAEDIQAWSKEGYFGVEMETSTIFAVSKHFGVSSSALLYVSDLLIKGQTVRDNSHNEQKEYREQVKDHVYITAIRTMLDR